MWLPTTSKRATETNRDERGNVSRALADPRPWRWVLVAMLVPLAFVAFWPSPIDQPVQGDLARLLRYLHAHGIPRWVDYKFVEATANVLLFVPVGFVATLAFTKKYWWQVGAFGLIVSGCMELGQLQFLDNRFASPMDLATNTGGAVIGAILAKAAIKRLGPTTSSAVGP